LGYYKLRRIETCQNIEKANVSALVGKVHPGAASMSLLKQFFMSGTRTYVLNL